MRNAIVKLLLGAVLTFGSIGAIYANYDNSCAWADAQKHSCKDPNHSCEEYQDGQVIHTGSCTDTSDGCSC